MTVFLESVHGRRTPISGLGGAGVCATPNPEPGRWGKRQSATGAPRSAQQSAKELHG